MVVEAEAGVREEDKDVAGEEAEAVEGEDKVSKGIRVRTAPRK